MNKIDIEKAILGIPTNKLYACILKGGNKYSRENAVCDEMVKNLGIQYKVRYSFKGKSVDIVELVNIIIQDSLEAKHYTPHQDKDLMYYLFSSAGGLASDCLKLRLLGFKNIS